MQETFHSEAAGRAETRSLPQLLRDLSYNVNDLVRSEIALAKAETSEKVSQVGTGIASIAAGAIFGLAALIIVLQALVIALSAVMDAWLASAIVGVVVAALAFFMMKKGQNDLTTNLAPRRTTENLRRDAELVSEQGRSRQATDGRHDGDAQHQARSKETQR